MQQKNSTLKESGNIWSELIQGLFFQFFESLILLGDAWIKFTWFC